MNESAAEAYSSEMRTREISPLELEPVAGRTHEIGTLEAILSMLQAGEDDALIERGLSLLSGRAQIVAGRKPLALHAAHETLAGLARLNGGAALRWSGPHAPPVRATGDAMSELGRIGAGLPRLEAAVRSAQAGVDSLAASERDAAFVSVLGVLVRSLTTLGTSLVAIREMDTAIHVFFRAIAVADTHPEAWDNFADDVTIALCNLTHALHERAARRRSAGNAGLAAQDISAARALLDAEAGRVAEPCCEDAPTDRRRRTRITANSRSSYLTAWGNHLLITAEPAAARAMFERGLSETQRSTITDKSSLAEAHVGFARAALALGSPREALEHTALALNALDRQEESNVRAAVHLVRAEAHRALGENAYAYEALEAHHALRSHLEEGAALQNAEHLRARVERELARADAESQRRIAAMLETLGQIGQEITAHLDTDTVVRIFARHVGSLLQATAFAVWLLDAAGARLTLVFGIEDERTMSAADIPVDEPESLAARAVRERCEIFSTQAWPDPCVTVSIAGTRPVQTALFTPLIVADRVLGVVSIQSEKPDAYSANACSIFRTLSTYAATALDNAAAYTKLEQTVVALQASQSELAKQTVEFERLSLTDALTGVANRRHLQQRAQVEIATLRRKPGQLAVAMFDIDHFKHVNDTHGHAVGDAVLQQVAQVAKAWLRPADLIARVGGEEFALLLPGVGILEAAAIAERIRSSIADTVVIAGDACVSVTSSFGVATLDAACDTLDHALSRADSALYAAKFAGRNRVHATPSVCL